MLNYLTISVGMIVIGSMNDVNTYYYFTSQNDIFKLNRLYGWNSVDICWDDEVRNCPSLIALGACSTKLQEMIARCRKSCGFCDQQPLCQDESPTKPVATGKKTEKARGVIHLCC